jgi:hypothetical protein
MVRMLSGNDNIDASVGLSFSLEIFKRYRRTGLLKAQVHHVPGIPGPCKAYIQLIDGFVSSCIIINKRGQRIPSHQTILCQLDNERGPFEWRFQATQPSPTLEESVKLNAVVRPGKLENRLNVAEPRMKRVESPREALNIGAIPKILSYPQWNMLHAWSPAQKKMLYDILTTIDGTRTIEEIKANLPLSNSFVEDALRVLLMMKVITLS